MQTDEESVWSGFSWMDLNRLANKYIDSQVASGVPKDKQIPRLVELAGAMAYPDHAWLQRIPPHARLALRYPAMRNLVEPSDPVLEKWVHDQEREIRAMAPSSLSLAMVSMSDFQELFGGGAEVDEEHVIVPVHHIPDDIYILRRLPHEVTPRRLVCSAGKAAQNVRRLAWRALDGLDWAHVAVVGHTVLVAIDETPIPGPEWQEDWRRSGTIELVLHGLDRGGAWAKVREIYACYRGNVLAAAKAQLFESRVTLTSDRGPRVDILLRLFDCPARWAIEEPVDVLSMFFDGVSVWMTARAALALECTHNDEGTTSPGMTHPKKGFAVRFTLAHIRSLSSSATASDAVLRAKFRSEVSAVQSKFNATYGDQSFVVEGCDVGLSDLLSYEDRILKILASSYMDSGRRLMRSVAYVEWVLKHGATQVCSSRRDNMLTPFAECSDVLTTSTGVRGVFERRRVAGAGGMELELIPNDILGDGPRDADSVAPCMALWIMGQAAAWRGEDAEVDAIRDVLLAFASVFNEIVAVAAGKRDGIGLRVTAVEERFKATLECEADFDFRAWYTGQGRRSAP
uniref:Uncharacterized protein n=1 Tax=Mycena chlorophos TaxID=658473 RepID=A0ABQ0L4L1_MYCCL|nr:predicted protein [Mycena chlorophos]